MSDEMYLHQVNLPLYNFSVWYGLYGETHGSHIEFMNLIDLFSELTFTKHIGLELGEKFTSVKELQHRVMYRSLFIWDYVFSVKKCEDENVLSKEDASFLLTHLLSPNLETANLGISLVQDKKYLPFFRKFSGKPLSDSLYRRHS